MRFLYSLCFVGLSLVPLLGTVSSALADLRAGDNLIRDGGFEHPSAPISSFVNYGVGQSMGPWTVVGSGNVALTGTEYASRGKNFIAKKGSNFLDLTGLCDCGAASGVAQSIATTPGVTYALSFWVGNTFIRGHGTTSTVNVYTGSTLLLTALNRRGRGSSDQVWRRFLASFVATDTTTTLSFVNGDGNGDINCGLDKIKLVAVP